MTDRSSRRDHEGYNPTDYRPQPTKCLDELCKEYEKLLSIQAESLQRANELIRRYNRLISGVRHGPTLLIPVVKADLIPRSNPPDPSIEVRSSSLPFGLSSTT